MTVQQVEPVADVDHNEPDPLLGCLLALSGVHDRPISQDRILAGLPLVQGKLTPELFLLAAERAGYSATIVKRSLMRLHPVALPAVLLMKDQDACLLLRKLPGKKAEIYDPVTGATATMNKRDLDDSYTGRAILVKPEADISPSRLDMVGPSKGHWFWGEIRRLWPNYLQVIMTAVFINLLALASPLFVMNVYDRVLPNKAISTLWVLAVGMGLAIVFDMTLRTVRGLLADTAGRRADVLLSSRIFAHVMALRLNSKPKTTGSFASQLKDFDQVREFFTSSTLSTVSDLLFFGLFLFVIAQIGGPIVFVPMVGALLVIVVGLVMQVPLRKAARKTQSETAYRHSLLVEAIASLETIKMLRAEGQLQRMWERLVGQTARTTEQSRRLFAFVQNFSAIVQQLVYVCVVIVGAYLFEHGEVSQGAIVACVILSSRAVGPLGQFAMLLARSQQSFAALRNLNQLMALESERPADRHFVDQPIKDGLIEFRNVKFTYPGAPNPAVDGLNFIIRPGEKVGIIGKIGSGKTTIGRLLGVLYEPQEGNILVDRVDTRQFHPHEIRRSIGVVTQDSDLFFGTVRSNITMGNPTVSDEQFIQACRMAGVDDFANRHPAGFNMDVGERGALLSGGQRQAVCLARALLMKPKVLFLDEPSGSMDLASERALIQHLKSAIGANQTLIVSTHRYSMLDLVDRIIVLANGKVAADGPKDKVLEALKQRLGKVAAAGEAAQ